VPSLPRAPEAALSPEQRATTRAHIRGSNLLLFGRLISLGVNFLVNVLTVRYLAKSDYGAFSFALSIGTTAANVLLLGMPRSVSRYAAIYQEREDYPAMYGSLVLSTGLIATFGAFATGLAILLRAPLIEPLVSDPLSAGLLMILIGLAPLQALDSLFQSMLAVFAGPSAIFFRRFVLAPLLRLASVALVIALGGSVRFLSWAYLVAAVIGILIYGPMLRHALQKLDLLRHWSWHAVRLPFRDILGFGLPLVVADALMANRSTILIVMLESMRGTLEVADYRAFVPIASLNTIVLQSMRLLLMPVASKLYARDDHASIDELYWQTTIWISVVSFPLFVPCIAMPDTLALFVCGQEYVASSWVLVALAIGEYFNAAMGLNTYTLQVYGRVRFLLWTTVAATAVGIAAGAWWIPAYGALGAAAATTLSIIVQNLLHHWGLHRLTEVELFRPAYLGVYASLAAALAGLIAADHFLRPHWSVEGLLVAGVSLALLRFHRHTMDIRNVFPELGKLPVLGRLLA
jgi:O-antigen/teichoic acid export membrane protein